MRRTLYAILALLIVASMVVSACAGAAPAAPAAPAEEPAAEAPAEEAAAEAPAEEAAAEAPAEEATPEVVIDPNRTQVRWFVGLGTGGAPEQLPVQQEVVDEFNASQEEIQLILEVVPFDAARDALATQIASGDGPDIIGPVGWGGSNAFYGQWLDIAPLIESSGYDTTQFSDELIQFYNTEEGQVGLPFAVFPAGTFFQKAMFDEAGLNYPPTEYGQPYVWPDGTEEEWSFDVLTKLGKMMTVDANGVSALEVTDDGSEVPGEGFDATQIVQYGYVPQYQDPFHVGTFFGAGSDVGEGNAAAIPDVWKESWRWWYDGIWGDQPFIPSEPVIQSPDFGAGNPFNSGKVAMAITHMWYTCCIQAAGESWDLAVLPTYNGVVNGRVDADTFRIWKGTDNPEAAFTVLSYLIGDASLKLLETYGGMPSREADQDSFFATKSEQFPWVENWDAIKAGLAYPDIPSGEAYRPNFTEVFDRYRTFGSTLRTTPDLDIEAEIETLEADLTAIMQKAAE
jgi:multiple sugar transport system substrate-binding protein